MPAPRPLSFLAHVLLPPLCVHCAEPLPGARPGICRWCRATLRPLPAGCRRCSLPRPGSPPDCDRCRGWPAGLEAVAATRYAGAAESVVHALKYRGWSHLAGLCADSMTEPLAGRARAFDAIVPVPLHRARLRERGFNQSELLGRAVGERLAIPLVDALARSRPTPSQVGLGRSARKRNVDGAFAVRGGVRPGAVVALVDDVATSGATRGAAAATLIAAGASRVVAVTFALALEGPPR
jgi:ComF family protein